MHPHEHGCENMKSPLAGNIDVHGLLPPSTVTSPVRNSVCKHGYNGEYTYGQLGNQNSTDANAHTLTRRKIHDLVAEDNFASLCQLHDPSLRRLDVNFQGIHAFASTDARAEARHIYRQKNVYEFTSPARPATASEVPSIPAASSPWSGRLGPFTQT